MIRTILTCGDRFCRSGTSNIRPARRFNAARRPNVVGVKILRNSASATDLQVSLRKLREHSNSRQFLEVAAGMTSCGERGDNLFSEISTISSYIP